MSLDELKTNRLLDLLEELLILQPNMYTLPQLADMCGVSREAVRKHLMSNYRMGIDYYQKSEKAAITVTRNIAIKVRRHYAK